MGYTRRLGLVLLSSFACGGRQETTTADSGLDSVTATDSGGVASTGDEKLDLADGATTTDSATGGGESSDDACKKVDVVISVDNSSSMQEEIEALRGPVFDSFPQTLLAVGNGLDDFHLAVIDACNDPPYFHDWGQSGACDFSTAKNFMISSSPDLLAEYGCVTELTQSGYQGMADQCSGSNDDEQPANTAADSVSAPAIDGANLGFLRNDAVLFVVAITDEDEKPIPAQSAQEVADKIIAAKGSVDAIVFLGIGGDSNCDGPYGSADEAAFLREVTEVFASQGRGLWWDLCQGALEQGFQQALEIVDTACDDFVPPG